MRKSLHSAFLVVGGLAWLIASLLPSASLAQGDKVDPRVRNEFLQGTQAFRRVLANAGMQPLTTFEALDQAPEQSLLIILGRTDRLREVPGGLDSFIRRGGAVLLASDQGIDHPGVVARQVQQVAGVEISWELLVCLDAELTYRDVPYCPYLQPASGAEPALFRGSRGEAGLLRVASNLPSRLIRPPNTDLPGRVQELAYLPPNCFVERTGRLFHAPTLFAVGGEYGEGRVLVLADHSLFINQMMLPEDNDNVEFTCNCVNWLAGTPRQRLKVLLVENGQIQKNRFDVPLLKVPLPAEELTRALLALGDRLVAERNHLTRQAEQSVMGFEERDGFNRASSSVLDSLGLTSGKLGRVLLVLLTLAGLLYALYRIGVRGRRNVDTAIPLLAQAAGEQVPTKAVLARRHREMMQAGNLLEPLQQRARAWFDEAGGAGHEQAPRVRVRGSWWWQWQVARRVRWFWSLARGRAVRVSPGQLAHWLGELERLQAAHQAGTLELIWEAEARPAVVPVRLAGRGGRG